jgi:hypothetical protein
MGTVVHLRTGWDGNQAEGCSDGKRHDSRESGRAVHNVPRQAAGKKDCDGGDIAHGCFANDSVPWSPEVRLPSLYDHGVVAAPEQHASH